MMAIWKKTAILLHIYLLILVKRHANEFWMFYHSDWIPKI